MNSHFGQPFIAFVSMCVIKWQKKRNVGVIEEVSFKVVLSKAQRTKDLHSQTVYFNPPNFKNNQIISTQVN